MSQCRWIPIIAVTLAAAAVGCQHNNAPPEPAAPVIQRTVTYRVTTMDNEPLGTIELPPGQVGTLTLTAEGPRAESLRELWAEVEKTGEARAKMHVPTEDGERGGLGTVTYRVGEADYQEGVKWMLMSRYFEVAEVK